MTDTTPYQITPDSLISDILARAPATGPILMQQGRMFRAPKGHLYADYSRITLGEYASLNGVDLGRLLKTLSAAMESEEMSRRLARGQPPPPDSLRRGAAIGYTSAYRDPDNLPVQDVVTAQTHRGLD